jgi:hypothetical protein
LPDFGPGRPGQLQPNWGFAAPISDKSEIGGRPGMTIRRAQKRRASARFQAEWEPVSRPESAPAYSTSARSIAKPVSTFAERALRVH